MPKISFYKKKIKIKLGNLIILRVNTNYIMKKIINK